MSESTKRTAAEVVIEVMRQVDVLRKTRRTDQPGKYLFRGIDEVMNLVGPALRDAGGFISPTVLEKSHETMATNSGGLVNLIRLTVRYDVYGLADLIPVSGTVAAESFDSGDKATAKAMSVAYRTFLLQLLTLPTETPDPDEQGFERGTGRTAAQDVSVSLGQQFKSVTEAKEFAERVLGHEVTGDVATWADSDIQALQVALETHRLSLMDQNGAKPAQKASGGPKPGHPTPDEERIVEAAKLAPDNSFLQSLAEGFAKHGSLTANQVTKGLEAAGRVLDQPRQLTPVGDEWPPDEEQF